jgi:hypothetical protein
MIEPVHQDSCIAEKQESHPALLLVVRSRSANGRRRRQFLAAKTGGDSPGVERLR